MIEGVELERDPRTCLFRQGGDRDGTDTITAQPCLPGALLNQRTQEKPKETSGEVARACVWRDSRGIGGAPALFPAKIQAIQAKICE